MEKVISKKYWFLCYVLLFFFQFSLAQHPIKLLCEYKVDPKGIESLTPRLSWQMNSDHSIRGLKQTAYQIQVSTIGHFESEDLVWDTDKIRSDASLHIPYQGRKPISREIFYWRVKIWDNNNEESAWSEIAKWEMGLLELDDWIAHWIEPQLPHDEEVYHPSPILRKEFNVNGAIKSARLYMTAHGVYEAHLNAARVGQEYFAPGWTTYQKRLQYQIYDVSNQLKEGKNAIAVSIGDGWIRGQFDSWNRWNKNYWSKTALLFQLEIQYENGNKETIISDDSWKSNTGPIVMSGFYDGETYDCNLELKGWMQPAFNDKNWKKVEIANYPKTNLVGPEGMPVKKMEEVKAKKIIKSPKGELIVDMGQNMVGWIKIRIKGQAGDTIKLHHAEVLDAEGNFYRDNLRTADQLVQYILSDDKERYFEPHFTFQGFRYLKLEGYSEELSLEDLTGIVVYTDMEKTGSFECSHPLLNQLQKNIEWSQKGNFVDIPMDCPQRDERMGWTGDAQVFSSTACFNFSTASFFTKWLQDVTAEQKDNGSIPWAVPNVLKRHGSAGWADAITIIPWTLYLKYGDTRILERQYGSMKKWVHYLEELSEGNYLVQKGFHFGDWNFYQHPSKLNTKPGFTDKDFIATVYFAHSSNLISQIAKVLEKKEDAIYYETLFNNIKEAFQNEYLSPNGRLSPHSQTAYVLALTYDLIPPEKKDNALNYLVNNIKERKYHLSTGFLGTPHICHVLSKNDHTDVAYKLLLQEEYPSWLYPITKGATTIWERWDGIKPDDSFQDTDANSFNHYAYGAIGDWMYSVTAGLSTSLEAPGYKKIIFEPHPTKELSFAKASLKSLYGFIASKWSMENETFNFEVVLPANTIGLIKLPNAKWEELKESGNAIKKGNGIVSYKQEDETLLIEIGSGAYEFNYPMPKQ